MDGRAKTLVICGLLMVTCGAALWLFGRHESALLPGDIVMERKNVRFHFPVVTCLVASLLLSLIAWLFRR